MVIGMRDALLGGFIAVFLLDVGAVPVGRSWQRCRWYR